MEKKKINKIKLSEMLRSGKSGKQCAEFFGVTEAAISRARKGINVSVVKNIALENAGRIVGKNLDAITELQKINRHANDLLDKAIEADDHATALNAMKEIRGQLSLQLDMLKALHDIRAVEEFQKIVLEEIGAENEETRNRIIRRLQKGGALRTAITIN